MTITEERPPALRDTELLTPSEPTVMAPTVAEPHRPDIDTGGGGRAPEPSPRAARWPWAMAVIAFFEFLAAGWWMMYVKQYAIGDATTRTLNAKLMVLSSDPHLGAIGFYWMPIPTFTRIPFVLLLQPFGAAAFAGPMTCAFFGALTIPIVASTGRVLEAPRWLVVTVCAVFALSPLTVYISSNGMSESTFACFIALTLLAYARWSRSHHVWDLVFFGVALALGTATRYEMLIVAPFLCAGVAVQLSRDRWVRAFTLAMIPTLLWVGAWGLASKLIMKDWLFFLHASSGLTKVPDDATWLPAQRTLLNSLRYSGLMVALIAPGTVFAVVAIRRNLRATLGLIAGATAMPLVSAYQVHTGTSWAVARFFMVLSVFGTVAVLWAASPLMNPSKPSNPSRPTTRPRADSRRPSRSNQRIGFAGVAVLVVGVVFGTLHLAVRRNTSPEGEYIFFRYLLGRDSATTPIVGGPNQLFESDLRQYYLLRDELDPLLAKGKKVATEVSNFETLITREPSQYVVPENRNFELVAADPIGRFDFVVIVKSSAVSSHGQALLNDIHATTPLGKWVKTRDYTNLTLWEFVPGGKVLTTGPDAGKPPPASSS